MLAAMSQQEMLTVNDVLEDEDEMNRMIEEWDKILANDIGDKKKLEQLETAVVTLEVHRLLKLAVSAYVPAGKIDHFVPSRIPSPEVVPILQFCPDCRTSFRRVK